MQSLDAALESISGEIGLEAQEIALRKAYLQFTGHDVARLSEIHDLLANESVAFAPSFYDHLLSFEPLRTLLPDPETISRLKHIQSAYFNALTAGSYDAGYVKNRLRVGLGAPTGRAGTEVVYRRLPHVSFRADADFMEKLMRNGARLVASA